MLSLRVVQFGTMLTYAVVEILGRQYKVKPDQILEVDYLGDIQDFECDKILVKSDDNDLLIGTPYLKDTLKFEVVESVKKPKIRVAKYSAKANSRTVKGSRRIVSRVKIQSQTVKKSSKQDQTTAKI